MAGESGFSLTTSSGGRDNLARDLPVCGSASVRVWGNMFEVYNWQFGFFFLILCGTEAHSEYHQYGGGTGFWKQGSRQIRSLVWIVKCLSGSILAGPSWTSPHSFRCSFPLNALSLYYSAVVVGRKGNPACPAMSSPFPYPHPLLTAPAFIPVSFLLGLLGRTALSPAGHHSTSFSIEYLFLSLAGCHLAWHTLYWGSHPEVRPWNKLSLAFSPLCTIRN